MENSTQVRTPFKLGHYRPFWSEGRQSGGYGKVLINAGEVESNQKQMSGNATNQDLASQNVRTSRLTRNNFRLALGTWPSQFFPHRISSVECLFIGSVAKRPVGRKSRRFWDRE